MSTVIFGGRGMLGRALRDWLDAHGRTYVALDRTQVDIADESAVVRALDRHDASVVINCAAYTQVDAAERDEANAMRVNGHAPGHLARACAARGTRLVHYSTDYVFAGDRASPYPVNEPLAPCSAYGRSKAAGEVAIREADPGHLILRTSWLYAPWATNFVRTIEKLSSERSTLRVVSDQWGRPTSAEHLARITFALVGRGAQGTLHVTDGGTCTWFDLACEVVRLSGHPCRIEPCTTADFPRPAKRPAFSVLDLARTEALLGPMPHWQDNLASVMARLER